MNHLDRHIPLEDRIWAALKRTCRIHQAEGHCPPCDERWAAIMLAISYERDLLSRHDAIVETVVRDRITEFKRAERYRLAWLSAKQGRKRWYELYLAALNFPSRLNDMSFVRAAHRNASAVRRLSLELADLRLAFSEMEGAKAREASRNGEFPGLVACYNNRYCATWGFCNACAPQIYEEAMRRYREAGGASADDPSQVYGDIIDDMAKRVIDAQRSASA